jgi:hypothetical protein
MRGRASAVVLVACALGWSEPVKAQWTITETDAVRAEVGANLQVLTGYMRLPELEVPGLTLPGEAGLGSTVGRIEWHLELGSWGTLDVHNRVLWQTSSVPTELMAQGFGVSRGADRRVETAWEILDGPMTTLVHDLDRLVLGLYFDRFDLYLGRQAIRWGVAELFPVADRFAPLSPFELDTLQRRGVDAVRAVAHLTADLELDVVVADRGPDEALSMAARLEYFGPSVDAYVGGGRFYDRASALVGASYLFGHYKAYVDAEGLWNLEERGLDRPRATVGLQRISMRWSLGAEYHYNGLGLSPGEYGEAQERVEFLRGESYYLGQHYVGVTGFYGGEDGWGVGGGVMANLMDPSLVVFPSARYEIAEQMSVAAGAYLGFGDGPEFSVTDLVLVLNSEYGSTPDLYFVQMTAFF